MSWLRKLALGLQSVKCRACGEPVGISMTRAFFILVPAAYMIIRVRQVLAGDWLTLALIIAGIIAVVSVLWVYLVPLVGRRAV